MSERPKISLESLPDWAREAVVPQEANSPAAAAAAHAAVHSEAAARPFLLHAAIVCRFLPRDLAPHIQGSERAEAEKVVLSCSEMVQGPDGSRWTLAQQKRVDILSDALASGELRDVLKNPRPRDSDPVNVALAATLRQAPLPADLPSLEARRTAVAMLAGLRNLALPSLAELDREIELRRLFAVFQRMTGSATGRERFFGRTKELEHLRDYVGVIPAQTVPNASFLVNTKEILKRGFSQAVRKLSGRAPLSVWGVGGVGKTTLISKFMLEHAEAARSRFPFAYLDFERTTISARRRGGLLAEMCLQTGAQFPELAGPMASLRERLEEQSRRVAQLHQEEVMGALLPFTREFRTAIDRYLDESESTFEWARPFLLVFDTFEVVQYSEDDVQGLEQFVLGFSLERETGMWPRLRLILSGRKPVKTFAGPVEELKPALGALDRDGSAQLLKLLSVDAGRPISICDALKLVDAVAKASGEKKGEGLHPLRLRLIGELFRNSKISGPELLDSLVRELEEPRAETSIALQTLIDGVLIRRVLGHVADGRVRALADPGLVVRHITPGVIQHVMTKATNDPTVGEDEGNDGDLTSPWSISAEEAEDIYNAFEHEVTLVDSEGDSLRHRPDVREQMLPLIQLRRPRRFALLNQLAFDFFAQRAVEDPSDFAAAAEAIYHGLWLGKPIEEIEKLWRSSPSFEPRIDSGEFGNDSVACAYLCAKAGSSLTLDQLNILPRELVVQWLAQRAPDLLKERRIESSITVVVKSVAGDNFELLDGRSGVADSMSLLLYRTGRWNDVVRLCRRHLETAQEPDRTKLMRILTTTVSKSGGSREELDGLRHEAEKVRDPETAVEMNASLAIAFMAAGSRETAAAISPMLPELAKGTDDQYWRRIFRVLRLWAVAGPYEDDRPLRLWVESRERLPRGLPMRLLLQLHGLKGMPVNIGEVWRAYRSSLLGERYREVKPLLWALAACDHSDWVRCMGNALSRGLKEGIISVPGANDPIAVLHWHSEDGTLLAFAADIASQADQSGRPRAEYPSDIFDLARALLQWHRAILELAPFELRSLGAWTSSLDELFAKR